MHLTWIQIGLSFQFGSLLLLSACGGGGSEAGPSPVISIEVSPSAVLLTAKGQSQPLRVRALDANGTEIPNAPLTFVSSQTSEVTISSSGVVSAAAPVGSALISVTSGRVSSSPLLAVVAETQPNAILISDAQVVVVPRSVAGSVVGVGGRLAVDVNGIATPAVGTVVLASGGQPIAGKVINASAGANGSVALTLESVPINQLFRNLAISGQLSPQQVVQFAKPAASAASVQRLGVPPTAKPSAVSSFGKFTCTTSFDPSLLNVAITPALTQALGFAYDFSVLEGVSKAFLLVFTGSLQANFTGQITVGAVTGSLDCAAPMLTIPIPITGFLAAVIVPEAPLGVALRADVNASTNVTYGVSGAVSADVTFGFKQDAKGQQVKINDASVHGQFDVAPAFPNTAARVQFTEFGGLTAGLTVGNIVGTLPNAVELRAGLEVSSAWGLPYDAARDPLFTTEYQFKAKSTIGPGPGLQKLLEWASIVASGDISFSLDTSLGGSPSPSAVRLSQNSFKTGETVSFNVALDPTTTKAPLGLNTYNVQEVRIYRLDDTNQTATQVASAVATNGQNDFAIPWQATGGGAVTVSGKPSYYAFVVPKFFDLLRTQFPIELRQVQGPSITVAPDQTAVTQGNAIAFDALIDGTKAISGVTWSATGGTITSIGQFTAGSIAGLYEVRATRVSTSEVSVSQVQVVAVVQQPTVSSVSVSPPSPHVGDQATFSVNGSNLPSGLAFAFPGCAPVELVSTSATLREFACTLTVPGSNLAGTVAASSGTTLYSFVVDVAAAPSTKVAARISLGVNHTCAVTAAGAVKCWGMNEFGELGDGTSTDRLRPTDVSAMSGGAIAVSAGGSHTCALTTTGGVKCWGKNQQGQLGDGTLVNRLTPVDVSGLSSGVTAISAGVDHTCALTSAAGIKCWGSNYWGQLGDGTSTNRPTPVDVSGLIGGVSAMASGYAHTCALTTAGGVKCWGMNQSGQLGDRTIANRLTPVNVSSLSGGVMALVTGYNHSCALTTTGGVKCWGANYAGQLGDPTLGYNLVPGDVSSLSGGASAIAPGVGDHNCVLTTAGGIKCWGANGDGEVGSGTASLNQPTPIAVVTLNSGVVAVAVGSGYTCALTILGGIKCWGLNLRGELGDGTTTGRLTPVDVVGF